jgi:hypothetical protein
MKNAERKTRITRITGDSFSRKRTQMNAKGAGGEINNKETKERSQVFSGTANSIRVNW